MKNKILLVAITLFFVKEGFSQNVGIGTTTPLVKLSVQTATGNYGIIHTDGIITLGTYIGNGKGWLGTKSNHPLSFFTNNSIEQMTLLTNGNFGIGTVFPGSKLSIQTPNNTDGFTHVSDGGIILTEHVGGVSASIGTTSNHTFRIVANKIAAINIDPAGNVGVGTTSPGIYKLKVSHPGLGSGVGGLDIENASTGDHWEFLTYVDVPNGKSYLKLSFNNDFKGYFVSSTGIYTSISDRRLKINIMPMCSMLEKIMQLQPSTYQFRNTEDKQMYNGFIAQDVEKLFPSLVVHNVNQERKIDVYTMDYSGFGVLAIKGIQELQPIIEEQKEKFATLENIYRLKIATLEERLSKLEGIIATLSENYNRNISK